MIWNPAELATGQDMQPPGSGSPTMDQYQSTTGFTGSISSYVVQCCECRKWRKVGTKDEFETIRENFTLNPWFCSKRTGSSCEDPDDIKYDCSRVWVIDKPDIPKAPPKTDRQVVMRGDLSKMDAYYVMPDGKRARSKGDVQRFLEANPKYRDSFSVENFSFTVPKIIQETVAQEAYATISSQFSPKQGQAYATSSCSSSSSNM